MDRDWSVSDEQSSTTTEDTVDEPFDKDISPSAWHGMGVITTGLFIVGEMAGGGIVAMPQAVLRAMYDNVSGWLGLVMIVLGAFLSAYTGVQLGHCWVALQRRFQKYREPQRKPYPSIAQEAVGVWARYVVSACIDITLFGVSVVFLLLASENIEHLLEEWFNVEISYCLWLIVVAGIVLPFTWLGTPKDFWPVAVGAMVCTCVATVFIFVGALVDSTSSEDEDTSKPNPTFNEILLSFGTILFAFGGHSAFPTIQHDMRHPSKFYRSVTIAYIIIVLMYIPVSIAAYLVYGEELNQYGGNVLLNIKTAWIQQSALVLITLHVLTSLIIVINPLNQELEEQLKLPNKFTISRVVSRTLVLVLVLCVAASVPRFGTVLNLIGASTVTLLTFVFPSWFHLSLRLQDNDSDIIRADEWKLVTVVKRLKRNIPWYDLLLNGVVISVGILGGAVSTYAAVVDIVNPQGSVFIVPCYINWTTTS